MLCFGQDIDCNSSLIAFDGIGKCESRLKPHLAVRNRWIERGNQVQSRSGCGKLMQRR
ncbi:hypothetical protein CsSME_00017039 [Camellia sinensis var. sinensis]